ncbi:hypothetical protein OSB04_025500, partial [Centaurea solstitialis]
MWEVSTQSCAEPEPESESESEPKPEAFGYESSVIYFKVALMGSMTDDINPWTHNICFLELYVLRIQTAPLCTGATVIWGRLGDYFRFFVKAKGHEKPQDWPCV